MTKNEIIKMRYPFFDEKVYGKGIELDSEATKEIINDVLDEVIRMYVPDGNPEIWLNKIQKLRDSE
jgi:hypothetical protein